MVMLNKFLQPESSIMKEQLLKDFLPDDACPLGAQLFRETPGQVYQFDSQDRKSLDEVCTLHSLPNVAFGEYQPLRAFYFQCAG